MEATKQAAWSSRGDSGYGINSNYDGSWWKKKLSTKESSERYDLDAGGGIKDIESPLEGTKDYQYIDRILNEEAKNKDDYCDTSVVDDYEMPHKKLKFDERQRSPDDGRRERGIQRASCIVWPGRNFEILGDRASRCPEPSGVLEHEHRQNYEDLPNKLPGSIENSSQRLSSDGVPQGNYLEHSKDNNTRDYREKRNLGDEKHQNTGINSVYSHGFKKQLRQQFQQGEPDSSIPEERESAGEDVGNDAREEHYDSQRDRPKFHSYSPKNLQSSNLHYQSNMDYKYGTERGENERRLDSSPHFRSPYRDFLSPNRRQMNREGEAAISNTTKYPGPYPDYRMEKTARDFHPPSTYLSPPQVLNSPPGLRSQGDRFLPQNSSWLPEGKGETSSPLSALRQMEALIGIDSPRSGGVNFPRNNYFSPQYEKLERTTNSGDKTKRESGTLPMSPPSLPAGYPFPPPLKPFNFTSPPYLGSQMSPGRDRIMGAPNFGGPRGSGAVLPYSPVVGNYGRQLFGQLPATDEMKIFACHLCSFIASTKEEFEEHNSSMHYTFACHLCEYKSRTRGRLQRHIKDLHMNEARNEPPSSTSEKVVEEVLSAITSGQAAKPRPEGGVVEDMTSEPANQNQVNEASHVMSEPSNHVTSTETKKRSSHKCSQCHMNFPTKEELWDHKKIHIDEDKRIICPISGCKFVTNLKHHLEYHLRKHYNSRPVKCPKCEYTCINRSMLASHLKSHSNVYQFRCGEPGCNFGTKYRHTLMLHMEKMNHERGYELNPDGSMREDGMSFFHRDDKKNKKRRQKRKFSDAILPHDTPNYNINIEKQRLDQNKPFQEGYEPKMPPWGFPLLSNSWLSPTNLPPNWKNPYKQNESPPTTSIPNFLSPSHARSLLENSPPYGARNIPMYPRSPLPHSTISPLMSRMPIPPGLATVEGFGARDPSVKSEPGFPCVICGCRVSNYLDFVEHLQKNHCNGGPPFGGDFGARGRGLVSDGSDSSRYSSIKDSDNESGRVLDSPVRERTGSLENLDKSDEMSRKYSSNSQEVRNMSSEMNPNSKPSFDSLENSHYKGVNCENLQKKIQIYDDISENSNEYSNEKFRSEGKEKNSTGDSVPWDLSSKAGENSTKVHTDQRIDRKLTEDNNGLNRGAEAQSKKSRRKGVAHKLAATIFESPDNATSLNETFLLTRVNSEEMSEASQDSSDLTSEKEYNESNGLDVNDKLLSFNKMSVVRSLEAQFDQKGKLQDKNASINGNRKNDSERVTGIGRPVSVDSIVYTKSLKYTLNEDKMNNDAAENIRSKSVDNASDTGIRKTSAFSTAHVENYGELQKVTNVRADGLNKGENLNANKYDEGYIGYNKESNGKINNDEDIAYCTEKQTEHFRLELANSQSNMITQEIYRRNGSTGNLSQMNLNCKKDHYSNLTNDHIDKDLRVVDKLDHLQVEPREWRRNGTKMADKMANKMADKMVDKMVDKMADAYFCRHCCISFPEKLMLEFHMSFHSNLSRGNPFQCAQCQERCADPTEFYLHIARVAHA